MAILCRFCLLRFSNTSVQMYTCVTRQKRYKLYNIIVIVVVRQTKKYVPFSLHLHPIVHISITTEYSLHYLIFIISCVHNLILNFFTCWSNFVCLYQARLAGCIEDLRRFSGISAISRLGAGDNQSLKFKWRGGESKPGPLAPQAKSLTTRPSPLPNLPSSKTRGNV